MASRNLLDPVPSQLTQLDWCVSNGPGTYPELLRQCQYSLTRLTIEYRRNFEDEKISLPELQYLQVNTMGFRAVNLGLLMRNLYTPALRQLVIGGLNWDDITTVDARSIMILLSLSGCCLTHLKVAFRLQPLCEDVSEFRELMQALPTLEALDLEGRSSDICATRGLREVFYSLTRDALEGGILPSLSEIIIVCECEDTELLPTNVVEAMLRSRTRIQSQTSQDRILLTYVNIRISWSHGFHQPALIWHKLNSGSIVREVAKKTENGSMMETTRMTL
ncbi:hypothetical protein NEOLEDRAFT_1183894 [Neolentinus lepideus HHB14362 ss-1]|uniref:F-box domain-containing protein n=1 Tax=Neolentinus lepideus HHB14362 ss-1 TaxID=1314782 RepID=A0A165MWU3_9AGAM|nr:hypothetical protein NEOLEDRAFT_1183894 [Neolentinus lepideus HHB14362 ss-1]